MGTLEKTVGQPRSGKRDSRTATSQARGMEPCARENPVRNAMVGKEHDMRDSWEMPAPVCAQTEECDSMLGPCGVLGEVWAIVLVNDAFEGQLVEAPCADL
jgi:hypothetical protein